MRIHRALHKTNKIASVPALGNDVRAFTQWVSRVPWLTKQVVVAMLQKHGMQFTDVRAMDCGIVMEVALFGTYKRRAVLDMAWVGRVVYDSLRLA
jgi:hypothetical protein